jgi:hypothetical protein
MEKIRLQVEKYAPQAKESKTVEPSFEIKGVPYYDILPTEPIERPRQTLLPMSLVGDWVREYVDEFNSKVEDPKKAKKIGWDTVSNEGLIKNPNFGSFEHYAAVEYDEEGNLVKFNNDLILWQDGKVDQRTGVATPGSVVAPIEKVGDNYYVHCFWQWRYAPWDADIKISEELTDPKDIENFKALNTGMWFLTTPGGFAQFVGESEEVVAKREAMEEAGLEVTAPIFTRKSFNRANVASLVGVGFSTFERVGEEIKQEGEKLFGKMAVRIDVFRTQDDLVAAAVNFAREELGLISSGSSK